MVKLIHVLSVACAAYTLFMLVLVVRNFVGFVSGPYIGRAPFFVATITFVILGTLSVGIPASLSYLLAVRRHRIAALILSIITCIGFPIGTILGVVIIYALTRPNVRLAFTPTT
jgi:hypothetical protein